MNIPLLKRKCFFNYIPDLVVAQEHQLKEILKWQDHLEKCDIRLLYIHFSIVFFIIYRQR